MAPRLRFKMTNGDEWISEQPTGGGGLADEVAFEREFKMSSAVLAIAIGKANDYVAAVAAAKEAGEEEPEPDGSVFPRSEWTAFFAWRKLRRDNPGRLPARFATFVDEVADMEYLPTEDDDDVAPAADEAEDEPDPLVAEAVALNGRGLDPTESAAPPTPRPPLSLAASATPTSN